MDPIAHHFLLSLGSKYDFAFPVNPYSLFNLVFEFRPPEDTEFPYVVDLWMFARLEAVGVRQYEVQVFAVRPDPDEEPELIVVHGPLTARFGDEPSGLSRAWVLPLNPFPRPGWYEFRLVWRELVLATQTVYLFGV